MAKSDIILNDNRISVVGGDGRETEGGRETGDLEVTVGEGRDPSVTLNADRANITLGGGDGAAPEGDVKLLDEDGNRRVQISAESGNRPSLDENRVWIDGDVGEIELGTDETGVRISGENGQFTAGEINVGGPVIGNEGAINGAAHITAVAGGEEHEGPAGTAGFTDYNKDEESVSIRGDSAMLSLGYSVTRKTVEGDTNTDGPYNVANPHITYETVAGENGKIFLDDGHGRQMSVVAVDGKLKIGNLGYTGDGTIEQEFLVIDPDEEQIRTPWEFVEE